MSISRRPARAEVNRHSAAHPPGTNGNVGESRPARKRKPAGPMRGRPAPFGTVLARRRATRANGRKSVLVDGVVPLDGGVLLVLVLVEGVLVFVGVEPEGLECSSGI